QHNWMSSSDDALHHEVGVFGDIRLWFRFYKIDDLLSGHDLLVDSVLDTDLLGNVDYTAFLQPPSINPNIEQDERDIAAVSRSHRLYLGPIPLTEQNNFLRIRKSLLKLFPCECLLKMGQKMGGQLSAICPATKSGGDILLWLPKYSYVRPVNFLVNFPAIYGSELRASIIPDNE